MSTSFSNTSEKNKITRTISASVQAKAKENTFIDNRQEAVSQRRQQDTSKYSSSLQKTASEEQELLQGKFQPIQRKENNTGLPDNLKTGMENLSGQSLDHVKVHYNSPKPPAVQAHAYAQGSDIHLASGQEKHLPHELGHVVQQMEGRVKPTTSVNGIAVNDNPSLEKEADVLGTKALRS
jgi:hypothetical protein